MARFEVRNPLQYYCAQNKNEVVPIGLFSSQAVELGDALMKVLNGRPVLAVEFEYERQMYYFLFEDLPLEQKDKMRSGAI